MGGNDGTSSLDSCERYDPLLNKWKLVASMQHRRFVSQIPIITLEIRNPFWERQRHLSVVCCCFQEEQPTALRFSIVSSPNDCLRTEVKAVLVSSIHELTPSPEMGTCDGSPPPNCGSPPPNCRAKKGPRFFSPADCRLKKKRSWSLSSYLGRQKLCDSSLFFRNPIICLLVPNSLLEIRSGCRMTTA